jgi:hypothetical protein
MRFAAAIVLASIVVNALQQTTIPILDASSPGSPVVISGTIITADNGTGVLRYSLQKNVSVTNVFDKSILLLVVEA